LRRVAIPRERRGKRSRWKNNWLGYGGSVLNGGGHEARKGRRVTRAGEEGDRTRAAKDPESERLKGSCQPKKRTLETKDSWNGAGIWEEKMKGNIKKRGPNFRGDGDAPEKRVERVFGPWSNKSKCRFTGRVLAGGGTGK